MRGDFYMALPKRVGVVWFGSFLVFVLATSFFFGTSWGMLFRQLRFARFYSDE